MAPERTERRLAAILSADAVGYSRLMAEDDAATVRLLIEHRRLLTDKVGQHGGRVVDAPGDNLLAEFPSVVDAVQCAVEIQRALAHRHAGLAEGQQMPFRIGVNLGDVVVEGERIHGEGVNVAARLEALADPGGICISGSAHEQVRNQLDLGWEDLGEQAMKNIPDAVRVFRVHAAGTARPRPGRCLRRALLAAAVAAAALCVVIAVTWPRPLGLLVDLAGVGGPPVNPPLPDRPSLVVLPFANLSDDPEQEWFSDGITEDLITDLSRHTMLFVIASNSAFTYKGRAVDVEEVGRELGVRYVVEGSVRRAGERIRVTAQLIDAASGFHRWSRRYDRDVSDVFEVQAELAEEIMAAVGVEVQTAEAERLRRKPTADLSAYESYLKSHWHFSGATREGHAEAQALLEHAVALDPDFAPAWAMLGQIQLFRWILGWDRDPAVLERAQEFTRKALELDPDQAHARTSLATSHLLAGRLPEAEVAAREAIAIDPNRPGAHFALAMVHAQEGRPLEAAASIRRYLRVNPRVGAAQSGAIAWINYVAGRTDDAVRLWEGSLTDHPDTAPNAWPMVHVYTSQGRHAEARSLVEAILAVNPELTVKTLMALNLGIDSEQRAAFEQSLRRAGMP